MQSKAILKCVLKLFQICTEKARFEKMCVFYCNILLLGNLQKESHEFGILKTYFPANVDIKPRDCY